MFKGWLILLALMLTTPCAWCDKALPLGDQVTWNKVSDSMDADVRNMELIPLMERLASETGWQVYVEPDDAFKTSVKFKSLKTGQALRRLLGDLNFTLVPQTNGPQHLYVFRTVMHNAKQQVKAAPRKPKRVPNELIVRVKPGTDMEALAKSIGAKITGKIPELGLYRLEFEDAAAVETARSELSTRDEVADVGYNYYFDTPQPGSGLMAAATPPLSLQLKPPAGDGRVIIGLVDTGVQSLGPDLDKFFVNKLSVAGDSALDSATTPLHGTSMAETMLRSLQAVTKGSTSAQILSVDVYGPNENTTTWNVANGIIQAVNNGANIINLSLGGSGDSSVLGDLIKGVINKGIGVVGAAGNEPVATPFFPAAYSGVLAVTALDQGKIAPYANFGAFVDVAAPGSSVVYYETKPWMVQGTSASAAYVSGMAAGIADTTHQNWNQIRNIIQRNYPVPK